MGRARNNNAAAATDQFAAVVGTRRGRELAGLERFTCWHSTSLRDRRALTAELKGQVDTGDFDAVLAALDAVPGDWNEAPAEDLFRPVSERLAKTREARWERVAPAFVQALNVPGIDEKGGLAAVHAATPAQRLLTGLNFRTSGPERTANARQAVVEADQEVMFEVARRLSEACADNANAFLSSLVGPQRANDMLFADVGLTQTQRWFELWRRALSDDDIPRPDDWETGEAGPHDKPLCAQAAARVRGRLAGELRDSTGF